MSEFRHHPLGSTYYLFMILVGLSAAVAWVNARFEANQQLLPYIQGVLYVLIAAVIIMIPLVLHAVLATRNGGPGALNPTLESLTTTFEVEAWKSGRKVIRKDRLRASAPTKVFVYRFRPSGSIVMTATLKEPIDAKLTGPVHQHDYILYQVEFDKPIGVGETVTVAFEYEVNDPNCTMKPYHSVVAANLLGFGSLSNKVKFLRDNVDGVMYEVTDVRTGAHLDRERGALFSDSGGVYTWSVERVLTANEYWISWRWK